MPIDPKDEKNKNVMQDPNVKAMDLAAISEKEVFVRKANLVSLIPIVDIDIE